MIGLQIRLMSVFCRNNALSMEISSIKIARLPLVALAVPSPPSKIVNFSWPLHEVGHALTPDSNNLSCQGPLASCVCSRSCKLAARSSGSMLSFSTQILWVYKRSEADLASKTSKYLTDLSAEQSCPTTRRHGM